MSDPSRPADPHEVILGDERTNKVHKVIVDARSLEQACVLAKEKVIREEHRELRISGYYGLVTWTARNLVPRVELAERLRGRDGLPPASVIEISEAAANRRRREMAATTPTHQEE